MYQNYPSYDQPCDKFENENEIELSYPHECPTCLGWRGFCSSCCKDHHKGGWHKCIITKAIIDFADTAKGKIEKQKSKFYHMECASGKKELCEKCYDVFALNGTIEGILSILGSLLKTDD